MSYLSRLARQSGLAAGPAPRSAPVATATATAPSLALDVEKVRDAPAADAAAPAPAPFSAPASPAAPAHSAAPVARPPDTPSAAEPQVRLVREAVRPEPKPSASPSIVHSPPVLVASEDARPAGPPGLVEVVEIREAPAVDRRSVDPDSPRAARVERTEARAAVPPARPEGEGSTRSFAARLAEVRAWVSATPAPGELAQVDAAAGEGSAWAAIHAPRVGGEMQARAAEPAALTGIDLAALAAGAPAETNHFTLSIGTLQLTVEEPPRPALPSAAPPAGTAGGGAPPLPAASRLGAHYLRV